MLFDGLILLRRGALCYFGPGRDAPGPRLAQTEPCAPDCTLRGPS